MADKNKPVVEKAPEDLLAKIAELQEAINAANNTIAELKDKLAALNAGVEQPKNAFKAKVGEGKEAVELTFELLFQKINLDGKEITAAEVMESQELQTQLFDIAWKDRTEAEFNENGLLKICY